MTSAITVPSTMNANTASFLESVIEQLGLSGLSLADPDFELKVRSYSQGNGLYATLMALDTGGADVIDPNGLNAGYISPSSLVVPASGGANLDGATGTATLAGNSTITVTVPTPADGGTAIPTGSLILATQKTPAGNTAMLATSRISATQFSITSAAGAGAYNTLLESAGVQGVLVAGTVDITLNNVAGDRLAVALKTSGGTPGILSVVRKNATTVTVTSWLAGTGVQALDTSTVLAYNFGQSAKETSLVNYAVIRP